MSATAKARAAAKQAADRATGRVRDQAVGALQPQLDAANDEIARLREQLDTAVSEYRAEIEVIWAELEAQRADLDAASVTEMDRPSRAPGRRGFGRHDEP